MLVGVAIYGDGMVTAVGRVWDNIFHSDGTDTPLPDDSEIAGRAGGKITGYTKHGREQAAGRDGGAGVNPDAIGDAVENPTKVIPQSDGAVRYEGKDAVVVLNEGGKVITTWPTNTNGWRNPSPEGE